MPNYKDLNGNVHFLDSTDFEHLLPPGCVAITDKAAATIQAASIPIPTYRQLRAAEYPPMTDYLDGIVKGDQAQVAAYISACEAVKVKYPKS